MFLDRNGESLIGYDYVQYGNTICKIAGLVGFVYMEIIPLQYIDRTVPQIVACTAVRRLNSGSFCFLCPIMAEELLGVSGIEIAINRAILAISYLFPGIGIRMKDSRLSLDDDVLPTSSELKRLLARMNFIIDSLREMEREDPRKGEK